MIVVSAPARHSRCALIQVHVEVQIGDPGVNVGGSQAPSRQEHRKWRLQGHSDLEQRNAAQLATWLEVVHEGVERERVVGQSAQRYFPDTPEEFAESRVAGEIRPQQDWI